MASLTADGREGAAWYQHAMRAHDNCVESLPLFTAEVFACYASGVSSPAADWMAGIAPVARMMQLAAWIVSCSGGLFCRDRGAASAFAR